MRPPIATLAAALALLATPVMAAPVVYGMTFFDGAGAKVGTGTLTRFPDQAKALFVDGETGGLCLDISAFCINVGIVQPIAMTGNVLGEPFAANNDLYHILTHVYDPRSVKVGFLDFSQWYLLAGTLTEYFLFIGIGDTFAPSFVTAFNFDGGATIGTVAFDRIAQIPLPAASLLFGAGIMAFRLRRRRTG